jgi:hypothetical protein
MLTDTAQNLLEPYFYVKVNVRVKVKFTLEQAMKVHWGYSSTISFTGRFTPRKGPGTHCIIGWVDPRASLDGYGKSRPQQDSFIFI